MIEICHVVGELVTGDSNIDVMKWLFGSNMKYHMFWSYSNISRPIPVGKLGKK